MTVHLSFAITRLIQRPGAGGAFEYVRDLRDAVAGNMDFEGVQEVLDSRRTVLFASAREGDLMLFRGRNALHRVTPTQGSATRLLVVFA